jgi:hypothetical protein
MSYKKEEGEKVRYMEQRSNGNNQSIFLKIICSAQAQTSNFWQFYIRHRQGTCISTSMYTKFSSIQTITLLWGILPKKRAYPHIRLSTCTSLASGNSCRIFLQSSIQPDVEGS